MKRIKAISSKMKPHCAKASFAFKVMATKVNVFLFTFNNMLLETLNKMIQVYQR